MSHFLELRQQVAECHITLRQVKDQFELAKAEAEQRAFTNGAATGSNEPARQRSLTIALDQDKQYTDARTLLRRTEAELARQEALLESAIDERRASEWQIRARLADALFRAGVQSDESEPAGDNAFDDVVDSFLPLTDEELAGLPF